MTGPVILGRAGRTPLPATRHPKMYASLKGEPETGILPAAIYSQLTIRSPVSP